MPWILVTLLITIVVLVRLWRTPRGKEDRRRLGEAVLGVYGALSMASILGVLVTVYLEPAVRVEIILILLAVYREADRLPIVRSSNEIWRRWRGAAGVLAVLMVTMYMRFGALETAALAPLHITASHIIDGDRPAISPPWQEAVSHRSARRRRVRGPRTSDAARLVDVLDDARIERGDVSSFVRLHHSRAGPRRIGAHIRPRSRRRTPTSCRRSSRSYAVYEEWLESNDWWIYRDLLRDYQIVGQTEWSYFWERRATPSLGVRAHRAGPVRSGSATRRAERRRAAGHADACSQVRMRYHVVNPWRHVPVVGALPRYVVEISGVDESKCRLTRAVRDRAHVSDHGAWLIDQSALRFSTIAIGRERATRRGLASGHEIWHSARGGRVGAELRCLRALAPSALR